MVVKKLCNRITELESVPVFNITTGQEETMPRPTSSTSSSSSSSSSRKRSIEQVGEEMQQNMQKKVKVKVENITNQLNDATEALEIALECIICYDQKRDTLFLPCCHLNTCGACASTQTVCPTCNTHIDDKKKVFL